MGKILYSLCGEGFGHATRSYALIKELMKHHSIKILCGGRSYEFLRDALKDEISEKKTRIDESAANNELSLEYIESLRIQFRGTKVLNIKTSIYNLRRSREHINSIKKVSKIIDEYKPDVILNDFEPWTGYAGKRKKIPIISIDNEHIITNAKLDAPFRYRLKQLLSYIFVKLMIPKADHYFITSFYHPGLKKRCKQNTDYLQVIVRDDIKNIKATNKKHFVLVYTSSDISKRLVKLLSTYNKKFVVYNSKEGKKEGNIEFKKDSNMQFFKDLAMCEAVITTAGLSLISEAIYLKKPVYAMPVSHFEQIMNAYYVEKQGYGKFAKDVTTKELNEFFFNLKRYRKNLLKIDNSKIDKNKIDAIKRINAKITELSR